MKNLIILGSGRSGTSMMAGCFRNAGYFMGNNLLVANPANPLGFFEDTEVNQLNEELLSLAEKKTYQRFNPFTAIHHPTHLQRWLLVRQRPLNFDPAEALQSRMLTLVSRVPFCFKDPRFSYTLPAWQPHLTNTVFLVVFRSPAITAQSIVRECERDLALASLNMTNRKALKVWLAMYSCILQQYRDNGSWLFVHYNQVLDGSVFEHIEHLIGAKVDHNFPTASLIGTPTKHKIPGRTLKIYRTLCNLAKLKEMP